MEKKMYNKYTTSQNDNLKNMKKVKEIKISTNYIPVKKTHAQSNISEYETEQSIQKNFSNKAQKNKQNYKPKSVQTTHNNQLSPKKIFNQNKSKRNISNITKSNKGSFYNLNNLNINDYFSEKVILTQKKFIDYKENKINTLKKELALIKREINLYEKKINNNNNSKNKSNTSNNSSMNKKMNKNEQKNILINKNNNNNKISLLNNNKSFLSLNTFNKNEIIINGENADTKLEKHLSNLLTENNSDNNLKYKNNSKSKYINDNKKNLLSIIYQSKKGCYNINNNNYDHNTKNIIKPNNINIQKENSFKNKKNILDKEIKNNLFFYNNKLKEKQIPIKDNKNLKKYNDANKILLDIEYQTLNQRMSMLFDSFFDYYDKNNQKDF